MNVSPRVTDAVILAVTVVWVASWVVSVVVPSYRTDPQIHLAFMAVIGGLVALRRKEGDRP